MLVNQTIDYLFFFILNEAFYQCVHVFKIYFQDIFHWLKKKQNLLKTTAHQFLLKREVQPAPFISSTVFFVDILSKVSPVNQVLGAAGRGLRCV